MFPFKREAGEHLLMRIHITSNPTNHKSSSATLYNGKVKSNKFTFLNIPI